jgi:hypothetical protein
LYRRRLIDYSFPIIESQLIEGKRCTTTFSSCSPGGERTTRVSDVRLGRSAGVFKQ